MSDNLLKGRGAQHNPHNRFLAHDLEMEDAYRNYCHLEGENETESMQLCKQFMFLTKNILQNCN